MTRKMKSVTTTEAISLPALDIRFLKVRVVGDSPLICHAWSEKARRQMLDKQMKKAQGAKEAKDPQRDYEESLYRLPDGGYGFPAIAFKRAAVSACRNIEGVTMSLARGAFHVVGELVPLEGEPRMREDMVRIQMTTDIRYRAEFPTWAAELTIRYNARIISMEQIVHLLNVAGFAVGIGERRPERQGDGYGLFHVRREGESS